MSLFSDNIKFLRLASANSQQETADQMGITRGRYVKYEDGSSEPPYYILKLLALHFNISIDILLSVDVRKIKMDDLLKLDNNRILLPIAVDMQGENLIEIIPYQARAGYTTGYADTEFIEKLPHFTLPFLSNKKCRAFPVSGDSMPPHQDKDYIVTSFVENLGDVVDGKTYIILTRNDGIVYKRLNKNGKNELMAHSDNTFYQPYPIKPSEILEIWRYECSIAMSEPKHGMADQELRQMIIEMTSTLDKLKARLNT